MRLSGAWLALALAVAAFTVHAWSLGFGFSPLDDRLLILDRVEWLKDPGHVPAAFREGVFLGKDRNFYRPLLTVSFMPDTWLGGGTPRAYHVTNVLLHVVATVLVFAVLQTFGVRLGLAFALALLFAVHPITAHAVGWIPGRNDTLLAVWVLAAFLCFERALKGAWTWAAGHAALFLLALLTKETAVLLPAVLVLRVVLLGWKSLERRRLVRLAAGWGAALAVWFALLAAYGSSRSHEVGRVAAGAVGEFIRATIMLYGKLILPLKQSVMPVTADSSLIPGLVALALTLVAALALGFRDRRIAGFGLAWFAAFLVLPTLAGSTGVVMPIHHEHRLYLPAVGFLIALAQLRWERLAHLPRWLLPAATCLLVAVLGARTVARSAVYQDPLAFAQDGVLHSPSFAVSYRLRGDVYLEQGKLDPAIADLERALVLRPEYAGALSNLGKAHYLAGRPALAIEQYTKAIAIEPDEIEHHNNRGLVYLMSGDASKAIADLDIVLARDPRNSRALNNRGKALAELRRYPEAIADLTKAIEVNPADGEALHNRAVSLYYLKDYPRAWADIEAARSLGIPIMPEFEAALRQASGR